MVDVMVQNNCVEDAWDLYSTILRDFAMSKQPAELMQVYTETKERDIVCNTISCNTMLDACAKRGSMDKVPQLLEDMKKARPLVKPDVITYSEADDDDDDDATLGFPLRFPLTTPLHPTPQ